MGKRVDKITETMSRGSLLELLYSTAISTYQKAHYLEKRRFANIFDLLNELTKFVRLTQSISDDIDASSLYLTLSKYNCCALIMRSLFQTPGLLVYEMPVLLNASRLCRGRIQTNKSDSAPLLRAPYVEGKD